MPAPFAALEARVNAAVMSRLSNADATLGGVAVQGIFDNAYAVLDVGGENYSTGPAFTLASTVVPDSVAGLTLVHNAVAYKVVEPMPDGAGLTVLRLRT